MLFIRAARILFLIAIALPLLAGCRVQRSAYQQTLEKFYRSQLTQEGEAGLQAAIDDLTDALKGNAVDSGLLALRANAYLDLIRLRLEAPEGKFDAELAKKLYADLRLLERLDLTISNSPAWIKPRIRTIAGDVLMLRASALEESGGKDSLLLGLYGAALDYYTYAAMAADQHKNSAGADDVSKQSAEQELANARDGYVNASLGMAQSETFLGLKERARMRFEEANTLLLKADAPFPPPPPTGADLSQERLRIPISLYSFRHQQLATVTESLVNFRFPEAGDDPTRLTGPQRASVLMHYDFALREWLVSLMLAYGDFQGKSIPDPDASKLATFQRGFETVVDLLKQTPAPGGS